ncbi:MAG: ferrous iron transport protein B [Tannerellaceae bacterium]|jgi:ferrous iron transport protein B|nr:ferrous iron transport protein B [Tannerellaceae bacterium]
MRLSELHTGEKGIIIKVLGRGNFRKRIIEMGFINGKEVEALRNAPLNDPVHYKVMGYDVSLRRSEAALIEIISLTATGTPSANAADRMQPSPLSISAEEIRTIAIEKGKTINVALVGNPNCGKTTIFNMASGAHEHTGNYAGVTVDAKEAVFRQNGYTFRIVDLPGAYSISPYSPEERYVRKYLADEHPDVVINVVDASNLERNFYLTTQLIDMDMPIVVALNMYDAMIKQGATLDCNSLAKLIGAPVSPTVGRTGEGIRELFNSVIRVYEGSDPALHHIHINYGEDLETGITHIRRALTKNEHIGDGVSKRLLAIRLLEHDVEAEEFITALPNGDEILRERDEHAGIVERLVGEDAETALTNARYGFIAGALRETFSPGEPQKNTRTGTIDAIVTHRLLGYPIFFAFMFLMFGATFWLGEYPKLWLENMVDGIGELTRQYMPDGMLKDLLVGGIITGVGGVVVFLPNILMLYLFISFMEDTGYMARAVFIMDKLMHKMGLHGRSFISLVMGFGCNVPAIMSARAIESRNSRMITMLVNPLMSCSARYVVLIMLAETFFPGRQALTVFLLYVSGIAIAVLLARLFKRFLFRGEDLPFVMELPPYRLPTVRSVLIHMWEKGKQFLRKMGGIILIASIIIWALRYFPLQPGTTDEYVHLQNSFIARIGHFIQPVFQPMGFDWKMSVAIINGLAAKEVIQSTFEILRMPAFSIPGALSFMFFIMLYFPCIATIIAISRESGSWKWGAFTTVYTCILAWLTSFAVYHIACFFTGL